MADYITTLPEALGPLVEAGKAYIRNVNVHDAATGRIIGQLQQTGPLMRGVAEAAASANPVLAFTKVASSVVGNVQKEILRRQNVEIIGQLGKVSEQLDKLSGQVQGLQFLTGLGAAASVLNVGVSVVGFALVLRKLDGMGDRIDAIGERIFAEHDRNYKIEMITELRRSDEAFDATPERQLEMWQDCERVLDKVFSHFLTQVSGASMASPDSAGADARQSVFLDDRFQFHEAADLLDWMVTTARARIEALLLSGQPGVAAQFAGKLTGWLEGMEFAPEDLVARRLPKGRIVSSKLRDRVEAEAELASMWVESARRVAEGEAEAAAALHSNGVDSRKLVLEAREHTEPALLYIPFEDLPETGKSVGRSKVKA